MCLTFKTQRSEDVFDLYDAAQWRCVWPLKRSAVKMFLTFMTQRSEDVFDF